MIKYLELWSFLQRFIRIKNNIRGLVRWLVDFACFLARVCWVLKRGFGRDVGNLWMDCWDDLVARKWSDKTEEGFGLELERVLVFGEGIGRWNFNTNTLMVGKLYFCSWISMSRINLNGIKPVCWLICFLENCQLRNVQTNVSGNLKFYVLSYLFA